MMNIIRSLFYRSFETELNPVENRILDNALQSSKDLRMEQRKILKLRETISAIKLESFDAGFPGRLMSAIESISLKETVAATLFYSLSSFFRPFAIVTGIRQSDGYP